MMTGCYHISLKFRCKILTLRRCSAADSEPTFGEGNLEGNRAPCCAWSDQCRKHGWELLLGVLEFHITWKRRESWRANTESHAPPAVLVKRHLSLTGSWHTTIAPVVTFTLELELGYPESPLLRTAPTPPSPAPPPPPAAPLSELERDTFSAPKPLPAPISALFRLSARLPPTWVMRTPDRYSCYYNMWRLENARWHPDLWMIGGTARRQRDFSPSWFGWRIVRGSGW